MIQPLVPSRRRRASRPVRPRTLAVALAAALASACSGSGDGDADGEDGGQVAAPASPGATPVENPDAGTGGSPDEGAAPANDPETVEPPVVTPPTPVDTLPTPSPQPEPGPEPELEPEPEPEPSSAPTPDPDPQAPDPAASLCAEDDGTAFCVERPTRLFSATGADGSTLWSFTLPGDNAGNDVRDVAVSGDTVYLIAANADGSLERSGFEPGGEFVDTLRLFDALAPAVREFALPRAGEALVLADGSLVLAGTACGAGDACRGFVATIEPVDAVTLAYRELGPAADAATAEARAPAVRAEDEGDDATLVVETGDAGAPRRWRADALVELDAGAGVDALAPPPAPRLRGDMLEPAGRWLVAVANGEWLEPVLADVDALIGRVEADVPAEPPATGRPANPVSGTVACDAGTSAAWERENLGSFADRYRFGSAACLLGESSLSGRIERTRSDGGIRQGGGTGRTVLEAVRRSAPGTLVDVTSGSSSSERTVTSLTTTESRSYGSTRSLGGAAFGPANAPSALAALDWSANGFASRPAAGFDGPDTGSQFIEGYVEVADGDGGTWTLGTDGRIGRRSDDLATDAWRPIGTGATVVTVTGPAGDRLEAELADSGAWRYRLAEAGDPDPTWRIVPSAPGGSFLDALWPE